MQLIRQKQSMINRDKALKKVFSVAIDDDTDFKVCELSNNQR